jgi:hypothetical protein
MKRKAVVYAPSGQDPLPQFVREADAFFEARGRVHLTMRHLIDRLDALGIDYALIGGMALNAYGYVRMTEDVDVVVSRAGLKRIHEELVGLGYTRKFRGSKGIVDTETQVPIDLIVAGEYPGSGREQPVSYPDPCVGVRIGGIRVLPLPEFVTLKLASGKTGVGRLKDLADIQELIKAAGLGKDLAGKVHPYVRDLYLALWRDARHAQDR